MLGPTTTATTAFHSPIPGGAFEASHRVQSGCTDKVNYLLGVCSANADCDSCGQCCEAGPRSFVPEDGINVVIRGTSDCPVAYGWRTRFYVARAVGGVKKEFFTEFDAGGPTGTILTSPSEIDVFYRHRLEVANGKISLWADYSGSMARIDSWNVTIPWSEVYVSFQGLAYQSDHHPFSNPADFPNGYNDCGYQGLTREIRWKNISVTPVKYSRTAAFPNVNHTDHSPLRGYTSFDLRDTQHYGCSNISGLLNVNSAVYDDGSNNYYNVFCANIYNCNNAPGYQAEGTLLPFTMPSWAIPQAGARLQLVYDMHAVKMNVSVWINGVKVLNRLSTLKDSVMQPSATFGGVSDWWRRSVDLPFDSSANTPINPWPATNTLTFHYGNDNTNYLAMDRIHFQYSAPANLAPASPRENCAAGTKIIASQCPIAPQYSGVVTFNSNPCSIFDPTPGSVAPPTPSTASPNPTNGNGASSSTGPAGGTQGGGINDNSSTRTSALSLVLSLSLMLLSSILF